MDNVIEKLKGGLIVSCQARPGNPLRGASHMAAMAKAAALGGAKAIRADGPDDIAAIKSVVDLPIIGIYKTQPSPEIPYITPDFEHAKAIADLGVEIVAVDATKRPRPDGTNPWDLIARIKKELGVLVMADIATYEEGVLAEKAGADIVATTLSGYTTYTTQTKGPDLELVKKLSDTLRVPVIAEGRYVSPQDLADGFEAGAHSVVIGKAITNVTFITETLIKEVRECLQKK